MSDVNADWVDATVPGRGVMLAARDYGGAGRAVVLIHGGPGQNLATWDSFVPHLGGRVRAVALDIRGNGASDDAGDYSGAALASDVAAIATHYALERPVVVGHSWGGQIAVAYAAGHKNCAGIVCVDGWVADAHARLTDDTWRRAEEMYRADPYFSFAGDREQVDAFIAEMRIEFGDSGAAVAFRQLCQDEDGIWRMRRTVDQLLAIEKKVDDAEPLTSEVYARVKCPVLFIGGEHSERERGTEWGPWAFSRAATEPIDQRCDHIECEWWPCGHDIPHLMPERLAERIVAFANGVS